MGQNKNNYILDKLSLLFLISVSFYMSLLLMFKFPITSNKFSYSNLWSFQDEDGAPQHQLNLVFMTSWIYIYIYIFFLFLSANIRPVFFGTNYTRQFQMEYIFDNTLAGPSQSVKGLVIIFLGQRLIWEFYHHLLSQEPLRRTSPPCQLEAILEDNVPSPDRVCPQG